MKSRFKVGQKVRPKRSTIEWYSNLEMIIEMHSRAGDFSPSEEERSEFLMWLTAKEGYIPTGKVIGFGNDDSVRVSISNAFGSFNGLLDAKGLKRRVWK